ncbi:MAG TPA: GNAT family N-acetyltransferase [Povalibacter sp.]|nr:GNAT family N-acetyltransferase [Povalibacter sp.]
MPDESRPSSEVTIRELRSDDRAHWNQLWAGYLEFYRETLPPQITAATWQRLVDPQQQPYGLVALDAAGRVVGFVHYHFHLSTWSVQGYCYLEDLFVDPAARNLGVGRALIEAVYRAADERGATRVYWHTENQNSRARALYDQLATLTPFVQYRR